MSKWRFISEALEQRRDQGLYRQRLTLTSPQSCHVTIEGQEYLAFCNNDYLGLANDPRLIESARAAMERYGFGGGASHLVIGHLEPHHQLEQKLAEFTGRERALLFSTGYMANLGVISALAGRKDLVLQDKLNHASLLDAGTLSGARLLRYTHNDTAALEARLEDARDHRTLVVTDGVFSMDGDIASLDHIAPLCRRYDAMLMVDDAHGFGVLGPKGGGCAEVFGLGQSDLPLLVGTLGKAFGTAGAFVAGSEEMIEYIIQFARTYIYTTSMPPSVAAATCTSLDIVQEESWRRVHLQSLIQRFRQEARAMGYQLMASDTPIQPILVGETEKAMNLAAAMREQGILITAIRPPTVPVNTSRLRVTFSAAHQEQDLDQLLEVLHRCRGMVS
ncbi:8-amino-7-oxononanoate synthase [Hahella sp. CCB-MM4]|uniref:8-amino-7-oxononanoate synthase n=1 Tax=Hahella sp. (strain CCB-MM4) TaxID=1926491 RepID=UPI000B9A48C8|nr:8-amino-7-oxononanoate synthase [Hahella sp. CCB-MM4]OZG71514.1 8-amino-7-oxononanoate synthase [Hahella sp. CCB-MM4]